MPISWFLCIYLDTFQTKWCLRVRQAIFWRQIKISADLSWVRAIVRIINLEIFLCKGKEIQKFVQVIFLEVLYGKKNHEFTRTMPLHADFCFLLHGSLTMNHIHTHNIFNHWPCPLGWAASEGISIFCLYNVGIWILISSSQILFWCKLLPTTYGPQKLAEI